MAREVLKAASENPPQDRRLALLGGNYGVQAVKWLYLSAAVVCLLLLVCVPLALPIMWWTKRGLRTRQWSFLFKISLLVVAGLVAVTGASSFARLIGDEVRAVATVADDASGVLGTYLSAWAGNIPGMIAGGVVIGVLAGFVWAWWDWQRTPRRKSPAKHKTVVQAALETWRRKRIAQGQELGDMEVVYGTEIGDYDSGGIVAQRIQDMLHTLLFGTTGSGKTQTLFRLLLAYIYSELPVFVIDMKGSTTTRDTAKAYAQAHGRPYYEFSLNGPMHYDMLDTSDTDPTRQKDMIIAAEQWSDEHYKGLAEDHLLTLFKIIQETGPMQGHSVLATVAGLLDPVQLRRFVDRRLIDPSQDGLRNQALAMASKIEAKPDSVSGLASKLNRVVNSVVGDWLTPAAPHFTLRQAFEESAVVMISLNFQNYPQLAGTVGSFVLQDLKSMAGSLQGRAGKDRTPWLVAIDEFTHIDGTALASTVQQIRESGARAVLVTQGKGDMASVSDPRYESVIWGQADTIIAHACDDETAEAISERAGERWGFRQSHDTNERNAVFDLDRGGVSNRGRIDDVLVPRISTDSLKHQEVGECTILGKFLAPADGDDGFWARARRSEVPKKSLVRNVGVVMDETAQRYADGARQDTVAEGEISTGSSEAPQIVEEADSEPASASRRPEPVGASQTAADDAQDAQAAPEPPRASGSRSAGLRVAPGYGKATERAPGAVGHKAGETSGSAPGRGRGESPGRGDGKDDSSGNYFDDWLE